jgi:uncharacterized membrane protein YkvA (DUF1232 family)
MVDALALSSHGVWPVLAGVLAGLCLVWLTLIGALWRTAPSKPRLRDLIRLLPDTLGMMRRLAGDRDLPIGVRVRLWLLLAYLAMPIDVVPDFIPVVGYADDAILIAVVLRSVARRAGPGALQRHWRGSPDGLAALSRLAGVPTTP